MAISAQDVKRLREQTGAGMMDCKRALVESGGDFAAAERRLKEMGLSAAAKRSGRATNEGRIFATANGTAAILELSSETDFVARNAQFVDLGERLVAEIAAVRPQAPTEQMQQLITDAIGMIKENIALRRFHSVPVGNGDTVAHYLHGEGNIGVLVKLHTADADLAGHARVSQTAFDLALHVAAFAPPFLNPGNVNDEYLAEQEAIFRKQAEALDKPPKVVEGIVKGKLRKHLQEVCLLEQAFVKDQKRSVKQIVSSLGKELGSEVSIADYVYYKVGETPPPPVEGITARGEETVAELAGETKQRMQKTLDALTSEFKTIRTGRASAAMFDKIRVEAYGQQMPINQTATISIPEARLVIIQPWDRSTLGDIERAIRKSDLSLNPSSDGKVIRINIPALTEERRKEIVKQARNAAEQARVAVRNIRRDLNEGIRQQKKEGLSEDEAKRESDQVQAATDERIAEINELLAAKEKEIMEI